MSFTLISTTNLPQVSPLRFVINIPLGAQTALSTPFAVMRPVPQIERLLAFVFHARNQIENISVWSCNLPWVYTCLRSNGWQCRTALPRVYPHGAGEIEEAHVQRVSRYISCLQITYPQVLNALQTNGFQVHPTKDLGTCQLHKRKNEKTVNLLISSLWFGLIGNTADPGNLKNIIVYSIWYAIWNVLYTSYQEVYVHDIYRSVEVCYIRIMSNISLYLYIKPGDTCTLANK